MRKLTSLKVVALLAIAGTALADYDCGPLEAGTWFVTPKVGVAPSIFASHRAHQQLVVPWAGVDQTITGCASTVYDDRCNVNDFAKVLQEGPCIGKFGDIFHQGVLHVGIEVGHNVCDNSAVWLEFIYNRSSGKCECFDPYITNKATIGCTVDCNTDCDVNCNDCCPVAPSISDICSLTNDYDNYQAYGAYVGYRYFTNRFWCDSTSWYAGFKVGILHRRRIDACTTIEVPKDCGLGSTQCDVANRQTITAFNRAIFCKSNSVSGGLQTGFDYCYNDCLSFQLTIEIVASCGLCGNRNHPIDIDTVFKDSNKDPMTNCASLPSNFIVGKTGAVVQFPITLGLQWNFGGCDPCCPSPC